MKTQAKTIKASAPETRNSCQPGTYEQQQIKRLEAELGRVKAQRDEWEREAVRMGNEVDTSTLFTPDDVSELYHIINSRGHCGTRTKLLQALRRLDKNLADRIAAAEGSNK